jgi:hypothetical protein
VDCAFCSDLNAVSTIHATGKKKTRAAAHAKVAGNRVPL